MTEPSRVTVARPLTAAGWAPFGWLPVPDTDPADAEHDLEFAWADPHLNTIGHSPHEVTWVDGRLVCTEMYRHDTHTQVLMPINGDAVVAVAPAGVELGGPDDLDTIVAFLLRPLDCFAMHRGTWHWGPFPLGDAPLRLLNVQGRRYLDDNRRVDLAATAGAVVHVEVPEPTDVGEDPLR